MVLPVNTASSTTPFSRFSRFGFSHKSHMTPGSSTKEEDWYIPYNGPYEPPKQAPKREKIRDSWGQVIDGEEDTDDDEVFLGDKELHARYGNVESEHRVSTSRARAQSNVSGLTGVTKSSGNIDPSTRLSISSSPRQSRQQPHPHQQPLPNHHQQHQQQHHNSAYLSIDTTTCSVGATPTPVQRVVTPVTPTEPHNQNNRISFAQLFSFGSNRKSSLLLSPARDPSPSRRGSAAHINPISRATSYSAHPYASTVHARFDEKDHKKSVPSSAPLISQFPSQQPPTNPMGLLRKASASTPNLRETHNPSKSSKQRHAKGRDKWFSPETWCDALFLPRPRFKLRDEGSSSSTRIVSPPGSPLPASMPLETAVASGVQSRVLAHSRSLVDLHAKQPQPPPGFEARGNTFVYRGIPEASTSLHPNGNRPKSWALDDLALPSPIPSLSKVLEEGDELEKQRQEWHDQAVKSFKNDLSRSISRSRSKSLGSKGHKRKVADTPLEFLAARTILGGQATMPTVIISEPRPREDHTSSGRSHSHKNSLTKTISTLSAISRGHSREDSWGRTAIKMAKSGAAMCGFSGSSNSTSGHHTPEDPTSANDLAQPAIAGQASFSLQPEAALLRPLDSPAPSALSDSKVGIAISTPPPPPSESSYDNESLRIHSHPYAQGGAYIYRSPPRALQQLEPSNSPTRASPRRGLKSGSLGSNAEMADYLASSRATNISPIHPYAARPSPSSSTPDLVRRVRADSTVSPSSKMWMPVAPGVVQEVLPRDFVYSPYLNVPEQSGSSGGYDPNRLTAVEQQKKKDRVSVGEALTLAMFNGKSGISMDARDSDNLALEHAVHHSSPAIRTVAHHRMQSSGGGSMRNRVPVQYDASRPIYQQNTSPTAPAKAPPVSASSDIVEEATEEGEEEEEKMITDRKVFSESPQPETLDNQFSPPLPNRPIGPVDDLDSFRDLFFKPTSSVPDAISRQSSSFGTPMTWTEGSLRSTRSSGLTQLARQLSQEVEEMRSEDSRRTAQTGDSEERLQFILSEDRASDVSSLRETRPLRIADHKLPAFQPSGTIPEDVEASSLLEPMSEEGGSDQTHLRVVDVRAVSKTPPTRFTDHRTSQHLSYIESPPEADDDDDEDDEDGEHNDTIRTLRSPGRHLLHSPFQHLRESYMTSSTGQSRMSGLSDFPSPPDNTMTPAHASILEAFFEEIPSTDEVNVPPSLSRRPTFGGPPDTSSP